MEPELSVILRRNINNKWTHQKYRNVKLAFKKSEVEKNVWLLLIGKSAKKTEIKVSRNIGSIHVKFLMSDGKATIKFTNPPTQCELITEQATNSNKKTLLQLLSMIQEVANGNSTPKTIKTKISTKSDSDKQIWMHLKRSLNFTDDHQKYLTVLNLKQEYLPSVIHQLPKEISKLGLIELNLNGNKLGKNSKNPWHWLGGRLLITLKELSMDSNGISRFPLEIISCKNLKHLSMAHNDFPCLPDALFGPKSSIMHCNLSYNSELCALPFIFRPIKTLDVTHCTRLIATCLSSTSRKDDPLTLLGLAANAIFRLNIPYWLHGLPRKLTLDLNNAAICRFCHRVIFYPYVRRLTHISLNSDKITDMFLSHTTNVQYATRMSICTPQCHRKN